MIERRHSEPYPSPDPASRTIVPPGRMLWGRWRTDEETASEDMTAEAQLRKEYIQSWEQTTLLYKQLMDKNPAALAG